MRKLPETSLMSYIDLSKQLTSLRRDIAEVREEIGTLNALLLRDME